MELLLHLVRVLWALCLALTIAIFPIAAPQAHAHISDAEALQAQEAAPHFHVAGAAHDHAGPVTPDHHDKKGSGEQGPSCCGTVACHAFLASVTPELHVTRSFVRLVAFFAEEQTDGRYPGSLDRPPRTA